MLRCILPALTVPFFVLPPFHHARGKWYRDTVRNIGPLTKAEMANQQQRLDETFQQVGGWARTMTMFYACPS